MFGENGTLIFWEVELLSPTSKKQKKSALNKFYIFLKMELSSSKIKEFSYFQKLNFVALCFSYISGSNFPRSKNEIRHS